MKTLILKKLFLVVTLLQMTAFMMSCSSGGGGGGAVPVPAVTYAFNAAGTCINTVTQQPAISPTLCTAGGVGVIAGYGLNPTTGQCVLIATGAIAPSPTYCGTGVGGGQVCNGQYTWMGPAGPQTGTCSPMGPYTCSGYTMINSAGQSVLCL